MVILNVGFSETVMLTSASQTSFVLFLIALLLLSAIEFFSRVYLGQYSVSKLLSLTDVERPCCMFECQRNSS